MLYEVKIYDGGGTLLNIVSPRELEERSNKKYRSLLTNRDRGHIMRLEDDEEVSAVSL